MPRPKHERQFARRTSRPRRRARGTASAPTRRERDARHRAPASPSSNAPSPVGGPPAQIRGSAGFAPVRRAPEHAPSRRRARRPSHAGARRPAARRDLTRSVCGKARSYLDAATSGRPTSAPVDRRDVEPRGSDRERRERRSDCARDRGGAPATSIEPTAKIDVSRASDVRAPPRAATQAEADERASGPMAKAARAESTRRPARALGERRARRGARDVACGPQALLRAPRAALLRRLEPTAGARAPRGARPRARARRRTRSRARRRASAISASASARPCAAGVLDEVRVPRRDLRPADPVALAGRRPRASAPRRARARGS